MASVLTSLGVIIFFGLLLALIPVRKANYYSRIKITIPVSAIVVSAYFLIWILPEKLGLNDEFNYFTARTDIKQGKIQIIRPGLIITDFSAERKITREFGFQYINTGCVVTNCGYMYYNDLMEKELTKRNGKDWQERLDNKLTSAGLF